MEERVRYKGERERERERETKSILFFLGISEIFQKKSH